MSMSLKVIECVPGDFGSEFKGLRCFLLTCHVVHENHETEYDGKELVFHHCSDRFLLIYYTRQFLARESLLSEDFFLPKDSEFLKSWRGIA